MPLYEFENEALGIRVDVAMPVDERVNEIVLTRRQVPRCVSVCTGAQPPTQGERLLKGYKDLEERGQFRDKQPGYLTAAQIKKAAALPDT